MISRTVYRLSTTEKTLHQWPAANARHAALPLAKRAGYVAISLREMISPHRVLGRKDAGQAEVGNSVVGTLHSTPLAKRAGYVASGLLCVLLRKWTLDVVRLLQIAASTEKLHVVL